MIKPSEVKDVLRHVIKNNQYLNSRNLKKNTICIEGAAGSSKTSIVEQLANEENIACVKLNLGQMEEACELIGNPVQQFETTTGDWLNSQQLNIHRPELTGRTRTSYSKPEWVPQDAARGGILLLDDYSRANERIIQACMEITDRQEYISWSLPENWNVVLTTNPDNGEYFVTAMDQAQKTRFIKLCMKFDIQDWGKWAEDVGIDSRCINFLLLNPEMIKDDADNPINARSATDFFNSISSIPDFQQSYPLISLLGNNSVGKEFTQTFINFLENKLDRIPSPATILDHDDAEEACSMIERACGKPSTKTYKQHIASVICSRLNNTIEKRVKDKSINDDTIKRTIDIMLSDVFSGDINSYFYKTVNAITGDPIYTQTIELIEKLS